MDSRCVVILSSKSAGSSVLHRTLASATHTVAVGSSMHEENETLYWIKVAAALGMPQVPMIRSVVPYTAREARASLRTFLTEHGIETDPVFPASVDDAIAAWVTLRESHLPVMVEKSPHHLCQPSALELLARLPGADVDADYLFVAIVRHPMEVCYSAWRRFRHPPEAMEREWCDTYSNLSLASQLFGDRLVTIRYEDLVAGPSVLAPVESWMGLAEGAFDTSQLHAGSLGRWRDESEFGFSCSAETRALAATLGYEDGFDNPNHAPVMWPLRRQWLMTRRAVKRWRREKGARTAR